MKKRQIDKKGYFFVIDSILALSILAVGAFLIFTYYTNIPSKDTPAILSEDIMDFFANIKIKDVDNAYAGLGGTLWETEGQPGGICPGEELIPNGENTLLQQVADFYEKSATNICYFDPNNEDLIERFINALIANSLPTQYNFEFWMDDQLMYPATELSSSKDAANVLIPSKKIVYGISDPQLGNIYGPYGSEVLVWQ
jgi:hypothetical protein